MPDFRCTEVLNFYLIIILKRMVVSFEGGNSANIYYLSASEIWHDKNGGLS
jgi:hypothetical protein